MLETINQDMPENSVACIFAKWHCRVYSLKNIFSLEPKMGYQMINSYHGNVQKYFMYLIFGTERITYIELETDSSDQEINFSSAITYIYLLFFIIFIIGIITLFKKNIFIASIFSLVFLLFLLIFSPSYSSKKIWMANAVFNGMIPIISFGLYWIIRNSIRLIKDKR
jgi:hypothetical protein